MNRPNFLTDYHISLLENLKSGQMNNMLYAVPYMLQNCPELTAKQAQDALLFCLNKAKAPAQQMELFEYNN